MLLFVSGCGSSGASKDNKQYLYEQLKTLYLWADFVPDGVNTNEYVSDEALLDDLKYKPLDRFSFIMDKDVYSQQVSQTDLGDGLRGHYTDGGTFEVYYVLDNSPAQKAGMQRGDIVLNAYYTDESQTYIRYEFERNGTYYSVTLTLEPYEYPVVHTDLFEREGQTIGYLRYDQFTSTSYDNIEKAFDGFSLAGIDELVLDLRYNPGGSIAMASILLDKIAGAAFEGQLQFTLQYNEANQDRNEEGIFEADENSLGQLQRIVVLTTPNTASASELVINALRPYIDVVTVGTRTYGKPVGMEIKEYNARLYFLVNFELVNMEGVGDYYDGFAPDCPVDDDLSHLLGDPEEAMTAAALQYLETGACL